MAFCSLIVAAPGVNAILQAVDNCATTIDDMTMLNFALTLRHLENDIYNMFSQVLQGVGMSAYTGTVQLITSKAILTTAASILATEAHHASIPLQFFLVDNYTAACLKPCFQWTLGCFGNPKVMPPTTYGLGHCLLFPRV
ncbi:hypothetical protein M422DRAFT_262555 [Sphaerobolus stellatus SS14]|uniref:Uncharacterized protein n=1 Tax=Sphaerobolus stellatus (strain SS14) TaxID=990650 RepID=A0A0C9TXI2_SPHS4|nr:hypothetical protein M422DRAFT_262555 [Sphaerobolus stellatus SS14]